MKENHVNAKNLLKFILGSAFGIAMFLVPIPQGESFTTLLDYLKNFLKSLFGGSLPYILLVIVVGSAILTVYDYICKPDWIRKNHYLSKAFSTTPLYLVSKVIGAIVIAMVVLGKGPEFILSADTGASMVSLSGTLFCIVLGFSFILPFLTDCGIMEFLGVLLRPVVRPLFHVPGRASVDLMASWFGASNAAVILTREQYMKGFYTKREAGYIMTNFSLVSIPFCLLVADTVGIANLFPAFYLCICVVGIILAVIIARIPPIRTIPDTYQEQAGKQLHEEVPQEKGILNYALEISCKRAEGFNAKGVLASGMEVVMGMVFDLIPIVIAWGTIALVIATYTPVFNWISYPMGLYMKLFGVKEAFAAAPATLVGFTDMFIPALLLGSISAVKTKFIVGVLSLVQIIYLTEVGTIIIKSEIPLNLWKLFVIFMERTLIAIPLIVLFANLFL
ncbi:YjiH family protein [Blautia faecicola]|uniref:YjiH family protein n=1 Tax=Blautia faecicola TaxID=2509240 RepID=A0A4Q1RJ03_9FIRM|nr:YjiH family protein [Blautia faecicola]RXS75588.1 YjiH family protein [Blautia faecicola]CDD98325.1 nucleoside recognition domain protein [Roseburia sp. CAG:471]